MITRIVLFFTWFFVWLVLSWPPCVRDIVTGILVSFFVLFMTEDMFSKPTRLLKHPVRYLWFAWYVVVFLWECLKANIDVAYRVIHPDLPIRPGTIKVRTTLKSDIALTFLTNSITLTPGTTSVDVDRDNGVIYVHWLCVKEGYDGAAGRLPVVERLEKILRRIFE